MGILNLMSKSLQLTFQEIVVKFQILAYVLRLCQTAPHYVLILESLLILMEQANVILLVYPIVLKVCSVVCMSSIWMGWIKYRLQRTLEVFILQLDEQIFDLMG